MKSRVAIIGGGITGLAAAWELREDADATVFESSTRIGGKIAMSPVDSLMIDEGADAFLARVPFATQLATELGLGDELVSPAVRNAYIHADGALRPIPSPQVLGVPLEPADIASSGLVTAQGAARAAIDLEGRDAPLEQDESIGSLIRRRLGDEVLESLVDPLLSGINAGDVDRLSVAACAPQLYAAARSDSSLISGIRTQLASSNRDPDAAVFHSLVPGMARLVEALGQRLDGAVRTGRRIDSIEQDVSGRWSVDAEMFDAVLLCVPAPIAVELLPDPPAALSDIEFSSVALLTFVVDPESLTRPLDGSGFLVQRRSGRLLTAASWSSTKWAHVGDEHRCVIRASVGRDGDVCHRSMDDPTLVDAVVADLEETMASPISVRDVRVTRYPDSLAQYRPGHLEAISEIRSALPRNTRIAGASYDGIGIPACIDSGRRQARTLLDA
jgi:oxygen-dependent protoporphyrinogen oxidase